MGSIFSIALQAITSLIGWQKEKSIAKHALDMAEVSAKTRALDEQSLWESEQLQDKDKSLRWLAYIIYVAPLIAYWISPTFGAHIEQGWKSLTTSQADTIKALSVTIFGYRYVPHVFTSVVSTIKKPRK
jgi:hypothetical protein